jgi:hypothetical protein
MGLISWVTVLLGGDNTAGLSGSDREIFFDKFDFNGRIDRLDESGGSS